MFNSLYQNLIDLFQDLLQNNSNSNKIIRNHIHKIFSNMDLIKNQNMKIPKNEIEKDIEYKQYKC